MTDGTNDELSDATEREVRAEQAGDETGSSTLLVKAPTVSTPDGEITVRRWLETNPSIDGGVVVEQFYQKALEDPAIADYFVDVTDLDKLRRHFLAAVLLVTGSGLTEKTAQAMEDAHRNVRTPHGDPISPEIYDSVIATLAGVLAEHGVPDSAIGQIAEVVGPLKERIAVEPSGGGT